MINKQLYLFVVTGFLIISGFIFPTRALAFTLEGYENAPQAPYWDRISKHLAKKLIAKGHLGLNTIYVDRKNSAIEVQRYIEEQLPMALIRSNARVVTTNNARYTIELDVEVNVRIDGHETVYALGKGVDELWRIQVLEPVNVSQPRRYQMVPLAMNQPVRVNPLSGTDTEIIITARIMERGWIRASHNYAFYFTADETPRENEPKRNRMHKVETVDRSDEFIRPQNQQSQQSQQSQQRAFLTYQEKMDDHVQQLIDSYQFDLKF